jgi:dTDP-4-dehydrorhamnose reductase
MQRILVTGAGGLLGSLLTAELGGTCMGVDLPGGDIADPSRILPLIRDFKPDVIINAAAMTDVDKCELNPAQADYVHSRGVRVLTETGVRLITLSTDQVFTDGKGRPLLESDNVEPVNTYALSKLRGEQKAMENPANCVVRTSWLTGSTGMIPRMAERLIDGGTVSAVVDQTACITLVDDLVTALVRMAFDETHRGLYHCVNPGPVTPFYLACRLRQKIGRGLVVPVEWKSLSLPAKRPVWSALGSERGMVMPHFEEAMELCLRKIL